MSLQHCKQSLMGILAVCMVMAAAAPTTTFAWSELEVRGGEEPKAPGKDKDQDQGQDNDQDQGQGDDDQQQDKPKKPDGGQGHDDEQDQDQEAKNFYRVDCRYHNEEDIHGIGHCYASAVYKVKDGGFSAVRLGVGCDSSTIYNDRGRIHEEELGERISPPTAAFPAIEIFPKGALANYGTYESVLDIRKGRLEGRCYVHKVSDTRFLPFE